MNEHLKNEIEAILNGSASIEETRQTLSRVSKENLRQLFQDDTLETLMSHYRENNSFSNEPVPSFTESEKDTLWDRINTGSNTSDSTAKGFTGIIKTVIRYIKVPFESKNSGYLGFAFAALLVLIATPSLLNYFDTHKVEYTGIKGTEFPSATLKTAIVSQGNTLIRPDRPLTENDTLAFRLNVIKQGYFSIYMHYNTSVDLIISDKLLSKGVHDLDDIYHLEGNQGYNTLVLISATDNVISTKILSKQQMRDLVKNNTPSLTLGGNHINMSYQPINIEKK